MQAKRVGQWVELGFWQVAVRLLSGVRPLQPLVSRAARCLEDSPLPRRLPWNPILAIGGWLLGLGLGYLAAQWWFV
jgi:hypothetical protein